MSTTVINILKDEHNDDDPNFVYIGRQNNRLGISASKWANPFVENTDGTRDEVIEKYRAWIVQQPELMAALPELKGKVLGCYCKPKACHGHVLVELLEGSNDLKIHPAAELFPPMTEPEFLGLKEDIREHGQREAIVVWKGDLIDGRHRLRACRELGIEPEIAELMDETDPWQYVVSHNLHRRHLTTAQRSMVADKLASLKRGEKKADTGIPVSPPSQAEAAAMVNVSVDSVQQARKIRKTATPETVAAVERGELSLNAAMATIKPAATVKPVATDKPVAAKPKRTSYLYSLDDYEEGSFHYVCRHHYLPTSGNLICISAVEWGDATGLGLNNGIQASVLIEKIGSVKPWTSISRRMVDSVNTSGCRFAREIDLSQMQPREGGGHYLYFEPGRVCYYDETAMNAILAKQAETERKKPDQLGS